MFYSMLAAMKRTINEYLFISHSSGGWESQGQDAGRFSVWRGPASRFIDDHLFPVSSHGRRGEGALWVFFLRALIPFMKAPPSWPKHFPKAPPPNPVMLGIGFQCINCESNLQQKGKGKRRETENPLRIIFLFPFTFRMNLDSGS